MRGEHRARRVPFIALSLVLLCAALASQDISATTASERDYSGMRLQIDNDLFAAGGKRDRDYTGGLAVTLSGRAAQRSPVSLDPVVAALDRTFTPEDDRSQVFHARQVGLMVFTPNDIVQTRAQPEDRPYASLLFIANGRLRVAPDNRSAWFSSFSIGALGLSVSEQLHGAVHDVVGSERPRGYSNQISAGGEPTARYTLAKQQLWMSAPSSRLDVKTTVQGSVGYLTETSVSISLRAGRFSTPWWSFNPELTDYLPAPAPIVEESGARSRTSDFFFFAGARVKARAYNAFLQGQFRDSEVRLRSTKVEPLVAEAWMGVTSQVFGNTQMSYTLNFQTSEIRHGQGARDVLWGAVQISHRF
jgi:hypothetical protein